MSVSSAAAVLGEAAAHWPVTGDAWSRASERATGSGESSGGDFQRTLSALGERIDRGEALVERALGGGAGMDAAELIALQAGIYRYSESVDLAAKLVDRAASAVRTTLQNQG